MAAPQHSQHTEGEGTAAPWTPGPPVLASASAAATPAEPASASTATATASVSSPSQIPVAVLASAPPAASAFPATRYPAIANRRTSSTSASPYPARSRIATTTAQPSQSIPASTSALLTAAQALAQQPASSSSNITPSLYGFGGQYSTPEQARNTTATTATAGPSSAPYNPLPAPVTTNNPSTRILSTANISTPVPSSASSSATFLTGRSQPGPSTTQTAAAAVNPRSAAPAFNPWAVYNRQAQQQLAGNNNNGGGNGGSNTPSRIGHGSLSLMQGVPLPLSFNSVTGSPRMHSSAQHHTGIYTAPQQSFPSAAAVAAAAAAAAANGQHHHHHQAGSRGSPTPRTLNIGGSALNPAMVGGLPGSTTSPPGGFPAWYRHPTSGLLPLLEVPAAFLSSGGSAGSSARPSAHHGRTGSTSALLRSSAALSLGGAGGRPSSAGPNSSTTPTNGGGGGTPTPPSATPNPLHAGPIAGGAMAEDTLVSFSWVIGELALLRDEVERTMPPGDEGRSVSAGAGRNPVWTTQPCFGDPKLPKWKLELVRTQRSRSSTDEEYRPLEENVAVSASSPPSEAQNAQDARSEDGNAEDTVPRDVTTVLSVYLTSLALEYLPSDALIPATIMLGLQPARTTLSRLQSRSGAWLWQSHHAFVFRREHEFFECHSLPTLSELLEGHEEVRAQDAVKLTVQIGCGPGIVGPETEVGAGTGDVGGFTAFGGDGRRSGSGRGADAQQGQQQQGLMLAPFPRLAPFQVPAAHYVSQTILDALEGLVDCARTGDVRIIVRERGLLVRPSVAPPRPRSGSGAMMEGSGSDDGDGGRWDEDEVEARSVGYVLPFPVGSFFPLDLQAEAEQQQQQQQQLEDSGILPPGDPQQQQQGPTSSATVVVRDRIIWAHSSVLRARSQYFADMMDGGFAEAQDELDDLNSGTGNGADPSSRALKTFRIPDSEWATVYWLIRYLYLEEIEFAEREDVRSAALDNEWMICAEGLYPDPPGVEQGSGWNAEEEEEEEQRVFAGGEEEGRARAVGGRGSGRPRPNWEWRTISELLGEEAVPGVQDSSAGVRGHHADDERADSNATSVDRAFTSEVSASASAPAAAVASSSSSRPTVPSSPTSSWRGHPGTVYSSSHPPPKMADESHAQAQAHVQAQQGVSSTSSSSSSSSGGSALSSSRSEHQQQRQQQDRLSSGSVSSLRVLETFADGGGRADVGQGTSTASTTPVQRHNHDHRPSTHQHPNPHLPPSGLPPSSHNDPHEHPAARAPPASALATYKLAHRYGQHGLAELAKAHIVETLSPQSAFPVLLATAVYSGLHEAIKRYVYEHWEEVSHTEEFERCCDEVGAGEWGTEAGRSLRIFMQSLLSPARILLASPQR